MVSHALETGAPNRATGADGIPYEIWKAVPRTIIREITHLFNKRLQGDNIDGWGEVIARLIPKSTESCKIQP
eukprot:3388621-Alexandrium_andersonii.AAC.1